MLQNALTYAGPHAGHILWRTSTADKTRWQQRRCVRSYVFCHQGCSCLQTGKFLLEHQTHFSDFSLSVGHCKNQKRKNVSTLRCRNIVRVPNKCAEHRPGAATCNEDNEGVIGATCVASPQCLRVSLAAWHLGTFDASENSAAWQCHQHDAKGFSQHYLVIFTWDANIPFFAFL